METGPLTIFFIIHNPKIGAKGKQNIVLFSHEIEPNELFNSLRHVGGVNQKFHLSPRIRIKSQMILILTCWIWQILEQRVPVKLTVLGRDNFSVDILLPPFEIAFQAAELVKMSSWNNAKGLGPLKRKKEKKS